MRSKPDFLGAIGAGKLKAKRRSDNYCYKTVDKYTNLWYN